MVKAVVILIFLLATAAEAANKSGVEPSVISLPSGPGSASGLGESFEPDLNTGTAHYRVEIPAFPGISGFTPTLSLLYDAGFGNGVCGLSWRLSLSSIQRQTDKGLPIYTDQDRFVFDGSQELVPVENGFFRTKIEGGFRRFQRVENAWRVWDKDGTMNEFGTSSSGRVEDEILGTFRWMLERSVDPHGNQIRYLYEKDGENCYLSEIIYGAVERKGERKISFSYEAREDKITDLRPRFPVTTGQRLKSISILSQDLLVRRYVLDYTSADGTQISLLSKVTMFGSDGATALPPLSFSYTGYHADATRIVSMENAPQVYLKARDADLVDMDGDSLPDLFYTPVGSAHRIYLNQGRGQWAPEALEPQLSPPFSIALDGVFMGDMDSDGLSDLIIGMDENFGFYRNKRAPWEEERDWLAFSNGLPFSLESSGAKLMDLNHDGLTDVLYFDGFTFGAYVNDGAKTWKDITFEYPVVHPDYIRPGISLGDPYTRIADMNGDGLEDILSFRNTERGYLDCLLSAGFGFFLVTEFKIPPDLVFPADKVMDGRVLLMDANSDGFADLLQVDNGEISLWLNLGSGGFGSRISIPIAPEFLVANQLALRQADMDGDGCRDLLYSIWNAPEDEAFQYVRFVTNTRPNLLTQVENGLGMVINIGYQSSTEYALQARDAENPWETVLPFPVTVVSQRRITDKLSGQEYVTEYVYWDGYYDGKEREFRGFARVEEYRRGEASAPTLKTVHVFDVGKDEESRKGMLLEQAKLGESGSITPPMGLFDRTTHQLSTRDVANGTNGEVVRFSFTNQDDIFIHEGGDTPRHLQTTRQVDDYGNTTLENVYGLIDGEDLGFGNDEILTAAEYEYRVGDDRWRLDLVKRTTQKDLSGKALTDTRNTYNAEGDLTLQEKWESGFTWIPILRNTYDAWGNIIRITDANDHSRTLVYDPLFHTFPISETIEGLGLSMTAAYDPTLGKMTSFTDPNSQQTFFGYDPLARLTKIVRPGDTEALPTQSFSYSLGDPLSRVGTFSREVSREAGTYDVYTYYDGLGRRLQTRSEGEEGKWVVNEAVGFNLRQEVSHKWLPYFVTTSTYEAPPDAVARVNLQYDAAGRVIRETQPDGSYLLSQYFPLEKREWDEEDTLAGGPHEGTPRRLHSNGLGRLVRVEEQEGEDFHETRYTYDSVGNLLRIVDDQDNVKTLGYDGLGRKTAMSDPDKGLMAYIYDPAGNLIETVDNKNQHVAYTYDAANRLLTESFQGERVRYHYDADHPEETSLSNTLGRLSWVEDESGKSWFSYDSRGNVILKGRRVLGSLFTTSMTYDALNRVTRLVYPDGMAVQFVYNAMNRLEQIPGYVEQIDYTASGQKSRFVYANGISSDYTHDLRQRLSSIHTQSPHAVLQDLNYTYDFTNNIIGIQDRRDNPTPEDRTQAFEYDDLYRLTHCTTPQYWTAYNYDSIGNLVSKTASVADSKVNLGILEYGEGAAGPHAVTRAGSYVYAYDGNGNIKSKTGQSFTFDYKDRMTGMVRDGDGLSAVYRYDHTGNRVLKAVKQGVGTDTTIYVDNLTELRGNRLIEHIFAGDRRVASIEKPLDAEVFMAPAPILSASDLDTNHDNVITLAEIRQHGDDYTRAERAEVRDAIRVFRENLLAEPSLLPLDSLAQAVYELNPGVQMGETTTRFYVLDHLGSAAIVTDAERNVVEESVLYPYGMNRIRTGDYEEPYRFTDKELDDESDFHYFGARYFDAMAGRFVSVDPLMSDSKAIRSKTEVPELTGEEYKYCHNSPIRFTDRFGYWGEEVHLHKTSSWAQEEEVGFNSTEAENIGKANIAVDREKSPFNVVSDNFDQTWHFNTTPNGKDTRIQWAIASMFQAVVHMDLEKLGQGLHALQDIFAHGDYQDPTAYRLTRDALIQSHIGKNSDQWIKDSPTAEFTKQASLLYLKFYKAYTRDGVSRKELYEGLKQLETDISDLKEKKSKNAR